MFSEVPPLAVVFHCPQRNADYYPLSCSPICNDVLHVATCSFEGKHRQTRQGADGLDGLLFQIAAQSVAAEASNDVEVNAALCDKAYVGPVS